ncbi:MAG: hypothetical protein Q9P01_15670 [Anaerolineae bacterium]|nr:hypothetical protein [Anaerolineae bacterium]
MVIKQQIINADVFWDLLQEPEYADKSWELLEGEMVEMSKRVENMVSLQCGWVVI